MGIGKATPSCCWGCISLKTASVIIGFLDMLHPTAVIVYVAIEGACLVGESRSIALCVFAALFVISRFWFAGLLIKGCLKNNYKDIWGWLLPQYITFVIVFVCGFVALIVGAIVELDPDRFVTPAIVGIYLIVLGSCIWVVRKFEVFLELQSCVPYDCTIGPCTVEVCINPDEISMEQRNL